MKAHPAQSELDSDVSGPLEAPMNEKGAPNVVEVVEGNLLIHNPTPRSRLRLGTISEVRRELARLYIEARRGEIETSTATRLAYMLTSLANMIRDSEMEKRIEALEHRREP